jgi:hypothetical protein
MFCRLLIFSCASQLVGVTLGQITSPSAGAIYEAGVTLTIKWTGVVSLGGTAVIDLETGVPQYPPTGSYSQVAGGSKLPSHKDLYV